MIEHPITGNPHEPDTTSGCTYGLPIPSGQLTDQVATVQSNNPATYTLPTLKDCNENDLTYDFTGLPIYITTSGDTMTFNPYDNGIAGKHIISFAAFKAANPTDKATVSFVLTIFPSRCFSTCETCSTIDFNGCITCKEGFSFAQGVCIQELPIDPPYCTGDAIIVHEGQCYAGCPNGMYGDIATLTCLPCHEDCATCKGPARTNCLSCNEAEGSVLAGDTCIRPTCPSGETLNMATLTCSGCFIDCVTCSGPSPLECTECVASMLMIQGRCRHCNFTAGLETNEDGNCVEGKRKSFNILVVGDGIFHGLTTECEDGNREDGDGCSSTGTIEFGY